MRSCLWDDHESDTASNAETHMILRLFSSSPNELWSNDVCNAIPDIKKQSEAAFTAVGLRSAVCVGG